MGSTTEPDERIHALIVEGRLDEAERLIEGLKRRAPKASETLAYAGLLAYERDELEDARVSLEASIAADPSWAYPRAWLAELDLVEGYPRAAIARIDEALPLLASPRLAVSLHFTAAEAAFELGARALVADRLGRIERVEGLEADTWAMLASAWLDLGDPSRAERAAREGLALSEPSLESDLWYLLGRAADLHGNADLRSEAWLKVRSLDLVAPRPAFALDEDEAVAIATEAFDALPDEAQRHLANLPILIADSPSEALVLEGVDPRLLGLFSGTMLKDKSHLEGGLSGPDNATLYIRNIERVSASRAELIEQIRITLWHETAHYFGLEDDALEAIGLG